jgi:hypothetical protein
MSNSEIDRLRVIKDVLEGKTTWQEATAQIDVCMRQVGYLCKKVREQGNRGIIHGLKGKPSNHQLEEGLLDKAMGIIEKRYADFGPTFANEKLREIHGIVLSTPTINQGMTVKKLWCRRKTKAKHRAWRERRSCVGMLVQLDGSIHDWFEGRGQRCVLILYIDDATSRIMYGAFVDSEDTDNLLRTIKEYLMRYGRPLVLYVDKDSIYVINRQATIEEELRDQAPLTQFTRAMGELSVQVLPANSPQAKGRVERSFGTHQDRLVKELRLAGISSIAAANPFLNEVYIPKHNARFAHDPAKKKDMHMPLLATHDLDVILSIRTERILGNDWTIRFQNEWYQITADQSIRIRPKNRITVEIRLDGTIHLRAKGQYLAYKKIQEKRYQPYYEMHSSGKYYPPKPGSLSYARQVQIPL